MVWASTRELQSCVSIQGTKDHLPALKAVTWHFIHWLRSVREPSGSEKENEVCELDNGLSKWSLKSVEEVLFDERFGCLEEEINKGAQTFIKVVGDFLANAVEVGVVTVWWFKVVWYLKKGKNFEVLPKNFYCWKRSVFHLVLTPQFNFSWKCYLLSSIYSFLRPGLWLPGAIGLFLSCCLLSRN